MGADAEVEGFLAGGLDEVPVPVSVSSLSFTSGFLSCALDVLVGANAGGFESLRAQLLILVGNQVDAAREVVDVGALAAEIEDSDLGVGHTTVEARLGVRLWRSMWSVCVRSCLPSLVKRIFTI